MTKIALSAAVLIFLFWFAAEASGGIVVEWKVADGGNGHYYEFIDHQTVWTTANSEAGSMSYLGMRGHLVTLTSAAENDFVFANVLPPTAFADGAWIGLTDDEAFGGQESYDKPNRQFDGWVWVTGESVSYTNWNPFSGEPNNGIPNNSGDDDYALMHVFRGNVWSDQTAGYETEFIVEYEQAPVPEPSSALALAGLFGIFAVSRHLLRPERLRHSTIRSLAGQTR